MTRLPERTVAELQRALDDVGGKKPTQRLTAAIAYKHGVTQTELAEWFGVSRRTIYGWFSRLEDEPIEEAVRDDSRPGRPAKLTDAQLSGLEATLQAPPTAVGYDCPTWSPALLREYLDEEFDVAYSLPSCRRLMKEAGLVYLDPADRAATMDDAQRPERDGAPPVASGVWLPE